MTDPARQQHPQIEQLGNGQLLVRGQALLDLARLARRSADLTARLDGVALPPRIHTLLAALEAEAHSVTSAVPSTELRKNGSVPAWSQHVELITTLQAAALLDVTTRYVREIAPKLEGRQVEGRWYFPWDVVAAAARERSNTTR